MNVICCLHGVNGMYLFIDLREMKRGINRINFIIMKAVLKLIKSNPMSRINNCINWNMKYRVCHGSHLKLWNFCAFCFHEPFSKKFSRILWMKFSFSLLFFQNIINFSNNYNVVHVHMISKILYFVIHIYSYSFFEILIENFIEKFENYIGNILYK